MKIHSFPFALKKIYQSWIGSRMDGEVSVWSGPVAIRLGRVRGPGTGHTLAIRGGGGVWPVEFCAA
jgi:hypothetical protein